MASSIPPISEVVSPFIRRATMNPAIWAGVASPARISVMAARASTGVRSRREVSAPSTPGQPPSSASVGVASRSGASAMPGEPSAVSGNAGRGSGAARQRAANRSTPLPSGSWTTA